MSNAKVLEFPKDKSTRVLVKNKIQEKKATVGLSIASIVVCAVFANQWMTKNNSGVSGVEGSRGVASFDAGSLQKDIRWEQTVAKELAKDQTTIPAAIATIPTLRDDLIFGYLEGRYGVKVSGNKITSIEFLSLQAGDTPAKIENKLGFLKDYSGATGIGYSDVSLAQGTTAPDLEVYNLIDSKKHIVGSAQFELDNDGRVKSIKFIN